jgi:1,2-dihydroxy-3-keto-5-methylthiopentene dioxygenase
MAILQKEDGTLVTEIAAIATILAPLNIHLNQWSVGDNEDTLRLLSQDSLSDLEKENLLQLLDHYFKELQNSTGYQTRDLIVLNAQIPNLEALLAKFEQAHTHGDDEVRYIIDGEGVFGFTLPDGSQVELTVQSEDYINVPANTEHWFHLTPSQTIKAIRYFTSTEGWVPNYTGTPVRLATAAVA